jgi:tetratricopeptide (TPR) repeat protein
MGYMGFGMQKWIYNQRPRRPFKKREKIGGHDTIDNYFAVKDIKIEGRTKLNPQSRKELLENINHRFNNSRNTSLIIAACVITITAIIVFYFKPWIVHNSTQYIVQEDNKIIAKKMESFNISMEYGRYNFSKKEYGLAIIDFENALAQFPKNKEALLLLAKSHINNCITNNNNCETALKKVNTLIKQNPDNIEYISYKIAIEEKINEK